MARMDTFKAAMSKSLTGDQPSDQEVVGAVTEVLDVIASIASSLETIAVNIEAMNREGITASVTTP
jgi:ACT domain-containing protein